MIDRKFNVPLIIMSVAALGLGFISLSAESILLGIITIIASVKLREKYLIKIPVAITNKSDTKHALNLFYYDIFDDLGNNIDEVAGYFDESLYYAEDLEPNESYTKYIYALYYNNDFYSLRIKNKEKTIFIKYIINK